MPGVTRDRIELETAWRGRRFALVDTGGIPRTVRAGVEALARGAGRPGDRRAPTSSCSSSTSTPASPRRTACWRRGSAGPPCRCSSWRTRWTRRRTSPTRPRSMRSGWASRSRCPACTAARRATCSTASCSCCRMRRAKARRARSEPRFALVGRPNVGKSSLFNRLVGEERSVVFEEAGTTRDAVDAVVPWPDGPVRFVDTAGMRRATKSEAVEYYSVLRATQAIERAHVAVLVIDAAAGLRGRGQEDRERRDRRGAGARVVVANKWDLVEEKDATYADLSGTRASSRRRRVDADIGDSRTWGAPSPRGARSTCTTGGRRGFRRRRSTRSIQQAQRERPTAGAAGNLHYATQVSTGPPTFVRLRRCARARPCVPAVHREPAAARVPPRGHPGAGASDAVAAIRGARDGSRTRIERPAGTPRRLSRYNRGTGRGAVW